MGIFFTLLVGLLSALVGVLYKIAAKKELNIFNITLAASIFSLFILGGSSAGNLRTAESVDCSLFQILFVILAGGIGTAGALILQRSMIYGNSGISWAIGQSALIVPFLSITLIFGESWHPAKICGTVFILAGMAVLSVPDSSGQTESTPLKNPKYGLFLALLSFAVLGLAQSMMSATSYLFPPDHAGLRPLLMTAGAIPATFCGKILLHDKDYRLNKGALLVLVLLCFQVIASNTLQFKALDLLKNIGMNGIFYPVAIGTGIGAYTLCSVLAFREKANAFTIIGIAGILAGILAYCL